MDDYLEDSKSTTVRVRISREGRPDPEVPLVTVTMVESDTKVYPDIVYLKDFLVIKEPFPDD